MKLILPYCFACIFEKIPTSMYRLLVYNGTEEEKESSLFVRGHNEPKVAIKKHY